MAYSFITGVFIAAFLLFSVQPMMAKLLLPIFGGGSAVWTACLFFYQTLLLVGYGYAYVLSRYLTIRRQLVIHALVTVLVLVVILTFPPWQYSPSISDTPFVDIFVNLSITIGAPYVLLSTTAPIIQHWLAGRYPDKTIYRLYSVSNVAAFTALICYPWLVESQLDLRHQQQYWLVLFAIYCAVNLCNIARLLLAEGAESMHASKVPSMQLKASKVSAGKILQWFIWSAAGVVILVATTSNMTTSVPPIPFLWLLPLALYLLTYILCFFSEKSYHRWYCNIVLVFCGVMAVLLFFVGTQFPLMTQLILYLVILTVVCMVCHGELASSKPAAEQLTLFYFVLAAGGAFGSLFASIIANQLFSLYYEYLVAILIVLLSSTIVNWRLNEGQYLGLKKATPVIGLLLTAFLFVSLDGKNQQFDVYQARNFYGTLQVKDITVIAPPQRRLIDGYTAHGAQLLNSEQSKVPLTYYRPDTGIGLLLGSQGLPLPRKVGVIGLGVGALAYYATAADEFVFYEINPAVEHVAKQYFDYLSASPADINVVLGDARVTLNDLKLKAQQQQFSLLVVDAFSSDAIPQHLITRQAFALYQYHLQATGVLAFHISNSYLDLLPVMRGFETQFAMRAYYFSSSPQVDTEYRAQWVVFIPENSALNELSVLTEGTPLRQIVGQQVQWSDANSSILPLIK